MNGKILEQIKKCREEKNITIQELSEITGISYNYLYQLEKGYKINPSLQTLEKLVEALGLELIAIYL